jgi:hypothetical protein
MPGGGRKNISELFLRMPARCRTDRTAEVQPLHRHRLVISAPRSTSGGEIEGTRITRA